LSASASSLARRESAIIVATISLGLALDQEWPYWGQWVVNAITLAVFFGLLWVRSPGERTRLWVCLALATAGEVFLSLVWGLYHYRDGGIPAFVPPGHVLLFVLGTHCVTIVHRHFAAVTGVAAAFLATYLAVRGHDVLSAILTAIFIGCLFNPSGRTLYAVMFLLALAMELYGTWLGNWRWERVVPYWQIPTLNPPFAAGVFYCLLDFLVVTLTPYFQRRMQTGVKG
jgi:hypothetical protein